jgi:Mrp family chromosome partitioning ATPase
VVYSSPRTPPRGGAGSGTEAELEATTPLPVAVGDGARPMPAPALRTKSGLFTSPQSAAFRLAGMGHILHQGQLKEHPHLFLLSAPDGARAEQYRLLRCRLQDLSDPRVIVVTSAVRGEGKTMATANLALAYAEGGAHSVIMIDAHLATPQLTELCGAEARPEVLSDADLSTGLDIWQFMPNLFLVPALGQRVKRSAVLSSPAFAMLIADLRQTFDYIIIDSPAVASAADAKIVMRNADAGLFLTKARSTTGQQVRVALDRLGRGVMAGVVLNEFGV